MYTPSHNPCFVTLLQILGTNDLVGVEYLTRGVRAAAAVGRILIRDEAKNASGYASGSGFFPFKLGSHV